jgi:hypothetical protein
VKQVREFFSRMLALIEEFIPLANAPKAEKDAFIREAIKRIFKTTPRMLGQSSSSSTASSSLSTVSSRSTVQPPPSPPRDYDEEDQEDYDDDIGEDRHNDAGRLQPPPRPRMDIAERRANIMRIQQQLQERTTNIPREEGVSMLRPRVEEEEEEEVVVAQPQQLTGKEAEVYGIAVKIYNSGRVIRGDNPKYRALFTILNRLKVPGGRSYSNTPPSKIVDYIKRNLQQNTFSDAKLDSIITQYKTFASNL